MAFLLSLIMVLLGSDSLVGIMQGRLPDVLLDTLNNLSLVSHFQGFVDGVISYQDVSYFAISCGLWLFLSLQIIDYKKAD
jgi:ABC-2 type transport system permease protein